MFQNKIPRRCCYVAVAALCSGLASIAAKAVPAPQWKEFRVNFYGYGGDYTEVGRQAISNDVLGGDVGVNDAYEGPFAVPKTYTLRNGAGSFTIKSSDQAADYLEVGAYLSPFFYIVSEAQIFDASNSQSLTTSTYAAHFFIQAQSQLVCPNETYNSTFVSSSLAAAFQNKGVGEMDTTVALPYCPEGGFPQYAEAQFWHGVW